MLPAAPPSAATTSFLVGKKVDTHAHTHKYIFIGKRGRENKESTLLSPILAGLSLAKHRPSLGVPKVFGRVVIFFFFWGGVF